MLDYVCVFTKAGLVLWSKTLCKMKVLGCCIARLQLRLCFGDGHCGFACALCVCIVNWCSVSAAVSLLIASVGLAMLMAEQNGNPVHALVSTVLLEEKGADRQHVIDSYALQWTFVNELDLVFVAVYQRTLQLLYVGELLRMMAKVNARSNSKAVLCVF